jgi:hypothetical protein
MASSDGAQAVDSGATRPAPRAHHALDGLHIGEDLSIMFLEAQKLHREVQHPAGPSNAPEHQAKALAPPTCAPPHAPTPHATSQVEQAMNVLMRVYKAIRSAGATGA